MMSNHALQSRRYDLDWLRVIAFGLLILYHIGMFYVTWGWHVKSGYASEAVEPLMRLLNPWRLPLLFFISGVAIRFAMDKSDNQIRFAIRRTWFLLLPIAFGIFVIVAPQAWLQLVESGEFQGSFAAFYPVYVEGSFDKYSIELPTWNHLWYVVYLMFYSLMVIPFSKPIKRLMDGAGGGLLKGLLGGNFGVAALLFLPLVPLVVYLLTLDAKFPTTHNLVWDWATHAHSFTFFLFGILLAKDASFWQVVERSLKFLLLPVVVLAVGLTYLWLHWDAVIQTQTQAYLAATARLVYLWWVILTLLALAKKYLNRPSPTLSYMTKAIFPWYILHQTLIVMAGYWLTRQALGATTEFTLLLAATFGGCFVLYHFFIRPVPLLQPVMGVRATVKR